MLRITFHVFQYVNSTEHFACQASGTGAAHATAVNIKMINPKVLVQGFFMLKLAGIL